MEIKMKALIKSGGIGLFVKFFGTLVSFFYSVLISHMFSANIVGLYYLAVSVLTIVNIFAKLGLENAIIKYVSIEYKEKNGITILQIVKKSLTIVIIFSICLIGLILLLARFISINIFNDSNMILLLEIMIFSILPNSILAIAISCLKGLGQYQKSMFLESVASPLLNSIILIALYFIIEINSYFIIAISYLISYIIVTLIGTYTLKNSIKNLPNNYDIYFQYNKVIRTAIPLLIVASCNYILNSTDSIMLGMMSTSAQVGIYNISNKVSLLPSMIIIVVNTILGPEFSRLFYQGKTKEIKIILITWSRLMSILSLIIVIVFFAFSQQIIAIFGNDYLSGDSIVRIVSLGQFVLLATGPTATLLMMTGYEKIHRNITFVIAILNISLNILLIPIYNAYGAALATTICIVIKNFVTVYYVWKKLGMFIYF